MSTAQFVAELKQQGILLKLVGSNQLSFQARPGALTAELRQRIVSCKEEIIELLVRASSLMRGPGERITPAPAGVDIPLSFAQQRLYFFELLSPGSNTYYMPLVVELADYPDLDLVSACLERLIRRHLVFQTCIREVAEQPTQVVLPRMQIAIPRVDCRHKSEDEQLHYCRELIGQDLQTPFSFSQGPLWRVMILITTKINYLYLNMHHLISDGWSIDLLLGEFHVLYEAISKAVPSPLPPLALAYKDYAWWQVNWLKTLAFHSQASFWKEYLKGVPHYLELPRDLVHPAGGSGAGEHQLLLSAELSQGLEQLFKEYKLTAFMGMLAFYGILLMRYSGQEDLVVGTPIANRNHEGLSQLVGMFVNTLALRLQPQAHEGTAKLLNAVRHSCVAAFSNQDMPFEKVLELNGAQTDVHHNPLFQAFFLYEAEDQADTMRQRDRLRNGLRIPATAPKFELTLGVSKVGVQFSLQLNFDMDMFQLATMVRMANHLEQLLINGSRNPNLPLGQLSMLSDSERHKILYDWNQTLDSLPMAHLIHLPFECQAAQNPDAIALKFLEQTFSYGRLNSYANLWAVRLKEQGIVAGAIVALCFERSPEMIVAILATLKVGAIYLPLDPSLPDQRLNVMVQDSGACCILIAADGPSFTGHVPRLELDTAEPIAEAPGNPLPLNTGSHGAYLIYTSGSSGQPKGVYCSHIGICNRLTWVEKTQPMAPGSKLLQKTNFAFDVSIWEIFWPLWSGGCIVLCRHDGHKDPLYLLQIIQEEAIEIIHFVPSMLAVFLEHEGVAQCSSLRRVYCSGEALSKRLQERFHEILPIPLHNLYGPTEAAIEITAFTCAPGYSGPNIPIGKPISNTQVYVLDAFLEPLPPGVRGELWLAGLGLAQGYVGRPTLTAASFIPNPFHGAGARLYRSGDIGSYQSEGCIAYHGRKDGQVKIRGFRIECGEIERALCTHMAVTDAVVHYWKEGVFEGLVAYYLTQESVTEAQLRAQLEASLPPYMVPVRFMRIESFPKTNSGKVDRRALPPPPHKDGVSTTDQRVLPPNPIRDLIAEVWRAILNREVAAGDNFFEIGGHSLMAIQVLTALDKRLGIRLVLRDLFDFPTLEQLTQHVGRSLRKERFPVLPPLVHQSSQESEALSYSQERLWILEQLAPGNPAYNLGMGFMLDGAVEVALLAASLQTITRRHTSLRTRFISVNGTPRQVLDPSPERALEVVDLSTFADPETHAHRLILALSNRNYSLSRGRLFDAVYFRLSAQKGALFLGMHHIISDGWSLRVLIGELLALYRSGNREAQLPTLPVDYFDFARWQRSWLKGVLLEQQLAFWDKTLHGAPLVLPLPMDYPRPARQDFQGENHTLSLGADLTAKLDRFCKDQGVTPFMTLSTVFAVLLGRYTGVRDMLVGTPTANRGYAEVQNLIGFFVNTTIMRFTLNPDDTLLSATAKTREYMLNLYPHQDMPFEKLVEHLSPVRDLGHTPVFQVMYTHQTIEFDETMALPSVKITAADPSENIAKFDLNLQTAFQGDHIVATFNYASRLFNAKTIARLGAHFNNLVGQLLEHLDQPIERISLLTEKEKHQLTHLWQEQREQFVETTYVELYTQSLIGCEQRDALLHRGKAMTYGELDRQSNRWAAFLVRSGVKPDDPVALMLPRSAEVVIAILAVLKAGGAYIPLDPSLSAERLAYIMAESGATLLVTTPEVTAAKEMPAQVNCIYTHKLAANEPTAFSLVRPFNLAYIIYTSGSSGRPKGCMIHHAGLCNYLLWARDTYKLTLGSRVPLHGSVAFDMSVTSLLLPLICGATIDLVEERPTVEIITRLQAGVGQREFTHLKLTPGHMSLLAHQIPSQVSLDNTLVTIVGGEALFYPALRRWWSGLPVARVFNEYGPTETVVGCCIHEALAQDSAQAAVAIGKPIANIRCYLVDAHGRLVAPGVHGELLVGGVGVSRGYLRGPAATAAVFVPDPFSHVPGERLYCTGDLARLATSSDRTGAAVDPLLEPVLEYLDRRDFQIKLRGYRIEPAEIEDRLLSHPLVREAVVHARDFGDGDKRLVAYLILTQRDDDAAQSIKAFLASVLPEFMLPSYYVFMEALPLAVSGKVDRSRLPVPEVAGYGQTLPVDDLEQAILDCFNEVLELSNPYVEASFFELGGHSLLTIKLVDLLSRKLGVSLPPAVIFTHPTVTGLAQAVRQQRKTGEVFRHLVTLRAEGSNAPMFWVHAIAGTVSSYEDLAAALGEDQPFYAFSAPGTGHGETPLVSIEALANHHIRSLESFYPQGPLFLGGWSFGGVTAFEMARQLQAKGRQVSFLAMIDAHLGQRAEISMVEQIYHFAIDLGVDVSHALEAVDPTAGKDQLLTQLLALAHTQGRLPQTASLENLTRLFALYQTHWKAGADYQAGAYHGAVTLYHTHEYSEDDVRLWLAQCSNLQTYTVPGNHYTMMIQTNAVILAKAIERQRDSLEGPTL